MADIWDIARRILLNQSPSPDRGVPDDCWVPQKKVLNHIHDEVPRSPDNFVLKLGNRIHSSFIRVVVDYDGDDLNVDAQKYNALTDEWNVFMDFSGALPYWRKDIHVQSIALKQATQELYAFFPDEKRFLIINYGTNSMRKYSVSPIGHIRDCILVNLDDVIYVTESKVSMSRTPMQMIPKDNGLPRGEPELPWLRNRLVSTVMVPSKRMILQFRQCSDSIAKYCFCTKKWSKIDGLVVNNGNGIRFENATLTADEQQVVIFAYEIRLDNGNRIRLPDLFRVMILDISDSNYSLLVSDISYRGINPKFVIQTGGGLWDEILVIGWIRILFASLEYKGLQFPPLYLMQIMAKYYSTEMIHVVKSNGDHYAIRMDVIRASLTPLVAAQ